VWSIVKSKAVIVLLILLFLVGFWRRDSPALAATAIDKKLAVSELSITDPTGAEVANLKPTPGGACLQIVSPTGSIYLAADDTSTGLAIRRGSVSIVAESSAELPDYGVVAVGNGKAVGSIMAGEPNGPGFTWTDRAGTIRGELGMLGNPPPASSLRLYDSNQKVDWQVGSR
jgi:hypothetical protein